MRHEVGDPFQHASWFQYERRESDSGQVHPYSAKNPIVEACAGRELGGAGGATDLSWDIREEIIDPSFSSLKSARSISVLVSTRSMIGGGSSGRGEGRGRWIG
jgi:hypothetical protein